MGRGGVTELDTRAPKTEVPDAAPLAANAVPDLPFAGAGDLEAHEGMRVAYPAAVITSRTSARRVRAAGYPHDSIGSLEAPYAADSPTALPSVDHDAAWVRLNQ